MDRAQVAAPVTALGRICASRRLEHALCRSGKLDEFFGRPSRARNQLATAIWTLALEYRVRAVTAESAFKRADERLFRVRWEVSVAAFTIGTKLKHAIFLQWIEMLTMHCRMT